MKKIIIFGLGETAQLAYEYFTHDPDYKEYEVTAFCADKEYITDDTFCGLPVIEMNKIEVQYPPQEFYAFASASSGKLNRVRKTLYTKAKSKGYTCVSYVSSYAFKWHNVEIGENCFILENNTLQPFTKIGNNVIMWSGNHLGHRSEIADHCFISSHCVISGYCTIGEYTFMGVNSAVADNVKIGKDNFIGMGSTINKNTPDDAFYSSQPAELRKITASKFSKVE